MIPEDAQYTEEHEWVRAGEGSIVTVGITHYAQEALGDIVFVDLPEVGDSLEKGTSFGSVESVKAVEDMYAPVAGEVVQRNEAVLASPEELQNDPHGEGWLLVLRPSDPEQLQSLMDAGVYAAKVNAG